MNSISRLKTTMPGLREEVLKLLAFLGLKLDDDGNSDNKQLISSAHFRIKAVVLETNEEFLAAREPKNVIEKITSDNHGSTGG